MMEEVTGDEERQDPLLAAQPKERRPIGEIRELDREHQAAATHLPDNRWKLLL